MTPLARRLAAEIAADGPITVADFMTRCLWDPRDGYYATRPRVGENGDFVTAPTISQMFGELLGLWAAQTWMDLGRPAFTFVEVGPGDGALMRDALRAARSVPNFLGAADVVLIDPSPVMRAEQAGRLAHEQVRWVDDLASVPTDRPVIIIANEVLDCLPARQFVRLERGWAERRVGVDVGRHLAFVNGPAPAGWISPIEIPAGADLVVEVSPAQEAFAQEVGLLVAAAGGAALLIDYGRDEPEVGDTLQALHRHKKVDRLLTAGEADLTMWADFPSVIAGAQRAGVAVTHVTTQMSFLRRLGIDARLAALKAANPDLEQELSAQYMRLMSPFAMGELFGAVCLYKNGQPTPPGFDEPVA